MQGETYEQMFKRHEDAYRKIFMERQKAYDNLVKAKAAEKVARGGEFPPSSEAKYTQDVADVTRRFNPLLAKMKEEQAIEASQQLDFENQMQYNFKVREQELAGNPLYSKIFFEHDSEYRDIDRKAALHSKRNEFLANLQKGLEKGGQKHIER